MPLTPAAVRSGLAAPAGDQLRVAAGSIRHPLLKPVVIDDRDGLTPDEAAVIAVVANPSLRSVPISGGWRRRNCCRRGFFRIRR